MIGNSQYATERVLSHDNKALLYERENRIIVDIVLGTPTFGIPHTR